jgi:alkaline phosphatase D
MPSEPVAVDWEVASDDAFRTVVARGRATAFPELAHSVHVDVQGLQPGGHYWYRFASMGEQSETGKAQTLPDPRSHVARVRFAALGCQHYETGYYTALRHAAEEELDFIYHFGDYIYEYDVGIGMEVFRQPAALIRRYRGGAPSTLEDYRQRYAQTKESLSLQKAHASTTWFCTYDDHEVQNNWVSDHDQGGSPPDMFLLRRNAALQPDCRRHAQWGGLLNAHFLNTRLYRSDQPCGDGPKPLCPETRAPALQVLGKTQEEWLADGLKASPCTWDLIAQQIMVAPVNFLSDDGDARYNMDSWAAYETARNRLFDMIEARPSGNAMIVTGDMHENWACDLIHKERVIASEIVSTSITSDGDGSVMQVGRDKVMKANPFVKWTNSRRGYVVSEVTPDAWVSHYRVMDAVTTRNMPAYTAASWGVGVGERGLRRI